MLFNEKGEVAKEALEKIYNFENTENKKLIYASTIGSISKSISRGNSDYDLRGIFVNKNGKFLDKKDLHNEKIIRFRIFDKTNTCNCIALWEASAFLNFIFEPYIDSGYRYKLIRNVLWSFNSPFSYDPYGLQNSLLTVIKKCISLDKEYDFLVNEIESHKKQLLQKFSERSILEIIHSTLYIKWICKFKELPPLSIYTLLNIFSEREKLELEEIINNLKNCSYKKTNEKNLLIKKINSLADQNLSFCSSLLINNSLPIPDQTLKLEDLIFILKNHLPQEFI